MTPNKKERVEAMFEEIIEFDVEALEKENLDLDKIHEYLDKIHDVPQINKKSEGHYVGVTGSTELACFGNAIWVLQCSEWFRKTVKRWELYEDGEWEEDLIETTEKVEKREGRKLYE